jgi:hypothetical protein
MCHRLLLGMMVVDHEKDLPRPFRRQGLGSNMKSMDKEVLYKEILKFFDPPTFAERTQSYWRQYVVDLEPYSVSH